MKPGFWSSFRNPALLSDNHSLSLGINYENRFSIQELSTRTAGLIIPAGNASLGVHYSNFGYSDFRRESAGIATGLHLAENLNAGIRIDYLSERTTGEYEDYLYITFETGIAFRMSSGIVIAVNLFNPVPNSLRKSLLPSTITAGAGVELSKVLFVGAEAEITTGRKLNLKTGFEYEVYKSFHLRGGFNTENTSFSFGLGYLFKALQIDLAFSTHERLGITSAASIIFKLH